MSDTAPHHHGPGGTEFRELPEDSSGDFDPRDPVSFDELQRLTRDAHQAFLNESDVQAYILTPGPSMQTNNLGVMSAEAFLGFNATESGFALMTGLLGEGIHGFAASDPDNNPETSELYRLGAPGTSGEGMRTLASLESTSYTGESQAAITFGSEGGELAIENDTMGIGFLNLTAYSFDNSQTTEKLFFNYGNSLAEPSLTFTKQIISMNYSAGDLLSQIAFSAENPFIYSDAEMTALRYKFGHDPTLGGAEERYTSTIKNAIDRSMDALCIALETKFQNPMQTFPRTPPLKVSKASFEAIANEEAAQSTPAGTTAGDAPSSYSPAFLGDAGKTYS
jgi:hypothetical protein